jgi:hypothetical protein
MKHHDYIAHRRLFGLLSSVPSSMMRFDASRADSAVGRSSGPAGLAAHEPDQSLLEDIWHKVYFFDN